MTAVGALLAGGTVQGQEGAVPPFPAAEPGGFKYIGELKQNPAGNESPVAGSSATSGANMGEARGMTLRETLEQVLIHNESLQVKMIDAEIARRQYRAERGIFEPAVVGSYERVDSERENTVEQSLQLFNTTGRTVFNEENDLYNAGLEFLSPVGSRFRLGYNLRKLDNNLNANTRGREYVVTVGATVTQPLLKNAWRTGTMARIRLAAINSDVAFQDYRRQLMLTVSRAEAAYWDLYLTQEQARISEESVRLAESLLKDNKARLETGKSAELEVMQADAGLALRRTRRNDATQKMTEAATQLSTMFSGGAMVGLKAVEAPALREVPLDYYDSYKMAYEQNPDYLTRRSQAVAENVRLDFAKNQLLPQLDLKGSYGFNGLGSSPGQGFDDVTASDYPAWSVGVEFRIPVTGGIKERNELRAARLGKDKSIMALREVEVQIGNALHNSILKVRNLRESVESYKSVIDFHEQLLKTQLARLEVGVVDSRAVLETEEKLFEAKVSLLDSTIQYQKGLLELELIKGSTLTDRGLDMTKPELQEMTQRLLAANRFGGPEFDALKKEIQQEYILKIKNLDRDEKSETFWERTMK